MSIRQLWKEMNYKERVFFILVLLTPFFDMLNGYFYRVQNIRGVGLIYHFLLTGFFLVLYLMHNKIKIDAFTSCLFFVAFSCVLSLAFNGLLDVDVTSVAFEREAKIISNLVILVAINTLMKDCIISKEVVYRTICLQIIIISSTVFVCNLAGISNTAYKYWGQGKIGLYTNSNELSITLAMALFFSIKEHLKKNNVIWTIVSIIIILDLLMTEMKFALGVSAIAVLLYFVYLLKDIFRGKISQKVLIVIIVALLLLVVFGVLNSRSIILIFNSIIQRQSSLFKQYLKNGGIIAYLSSGRSERFKSLVFAPLSSMLTSGNISKIIKAVIWILFGNGLSSEYNFTFEMDGFDIYLLNGVTGFLAYLIMCLYLIKKCSIRTNKIVDYFYIFIGVLASFVVGHVLTGGVCGLYFGIFVGYFCNQEIENV